MPTVIGRTNFRVGADSRGLTADLNRANKTLSVQLRRGAQLAGRAFTRSLQQAIVRPVLGIGGIVAGAFAIRGVVTNFTRGINDARTSLDELAKSSRNLDLAVPEFQTLSLVAEEAGVGIDTFTQSLGFLQERLGDVSLRASGEAVEAFEILGISIENAANQSQLELFQNIAEALGDISNQSQRVFLARRLLGESGGRLIGLFRSGSLREQIQEASSFLQNTGISFSRQELQGVELVNDRFARLGLAIDGVYRNLIIKFSPSLLYIANELTETFGELNRTIRGRDFTAANEQLRKDFDDILQQVITGIKQGAEELGDIDFGLIAASAKEITKSFLEIATNPDLIKGVGFLVKTIANFGYALSQAASAIAAAVDAVANLGLAIYNFGILLKDGITSIGPSPISTAARLQLLEASKQAIALHFEAAGEAIIKAAKETGGAFDTVSQNPILGATAGAQIGKRLVKPLSETILNIGEKYLRPGLVGRQTQSAGEIVRLQVQRERQQNVKERLERIRQSGQQLEGENLAEFNELVAESKAFGRAITRATLVNEIDTLITGGLIKTFTGIGATLSFIGRHGGVLGGIVGLVRNAQIRQQYQSAIEQRQLAISQQQAEQDTASPTTPTRPQAPQLTLKAQSALLDLTNFIQTLESASEVRLPFDSETQSLNQLAQAAEQAGVPIENLNELLAEGGERIRLLNFDAISKEMDEFLLSTTPREQNIFTQFDEDAAKLLDRLRAVSQADDVIIESYERQIQLARQLQGQQEFENLFSQLKQFQRQLSRPTAKSTYSELLVEINQLENAFIRLNDAASGLNFYNPKIKEGFDQLRQGAQTAAVQSSEYFQAAMSNIDAAVGEMVRNGKFQFRDLVRSILADLAQITIRRNITEPLFGALFGAIGASAGDAAAGAGAAAGKATGGPVVAGVAYTVGERGRELFIPDTNGQIVPNHALVRHSSDFEGQGDRNITVNQSVHIEAGVSRDELEYGLANAQTNMMNELQRNQSLRSSLRG